MTTSLKFLKVFTIITTIFLTSCGFGQYNSSNPDNIPDRHKGDEYVYGDGVGKPARQLANPDESTPESLKRTIAIKDILYPKEVKKEVSMEKTEATHDEVSTEATENAPVSESEEEEVVEEDE